ncbi:hypothetical protein HRG84_09215 [Flavisolibacter sp. BT320]|nr:hypothetical protein [Flavisolibacter longurius]
MFTIEQVDDIIVKKDSSPFLKVKRKFGWGITSKFFRQEKLILESYLITPFLFQKVKINYQDLPNPIELRKNSKLYYALHCNDEVFSLKLRYFRKPSFILYKKDSEVAHISGLRLVTFGGRAYKMETSINDDEENTLLLILFLSQLRGFGGGNP